MAYPEGFVWGAAAAAYQIEGAAYEDGKGLCIWDVFCRKKGAIWQGHTGDVACDHYHRFRDDVDLMQQIGIRAYRFSISWPRLLPEGTGAVNQAGVDFYDRLIDALLAAGIRPYVTLFHWDYPYELFCRGGWLNGESSDWFAEYAALVTDSYSDRVSDWMTLNEPNGFMRAGYRAGFHAPGLTLGVTEYLRAIHNVLLSHGKAVQAIRAGARSAPSVSSVHAASNVKIPDSDSDLDVAAARRAMFSLTSAVPEENASFDSWWLDPIYLGGYPEDGLAVFEPYLPEIGQADMEIIHQPLDAFCFNNYRGQVVRAGSDGPEQVDAPLGASLVASSWSVTPDALYWGPRFYQERYGLPIMITENGMSAMDWVATDGLVHDPQRIDFLRRYLLALRRACADGVDVRAYFHWSILDNFEWSAGYKERYGLIFVDYSTQERILKDSAHWYRDVIASNGENL